MAYVVLSACIDQLDQSCIEECPVDSIYQGKRKMYINPVECIDCGACEVACPVGAITSKKNVPAEELAFAADNAFFFETVLQGRDAPIGNPGGSAAIPAIGVDTPLVRDHVA